jgi:gas vesicle protein
MSYAGKDSRSRRVSSSTATQPPTVLRTRARSGRHVLEREIAITSRGVARPPSEWASEEDELDWQHIGIFAAGALLGVAIGAGAALLFAPQSGQDTRHDIVRRGRHLRLRASDAWDDLRSELRYAARTGRRKLARRFGHAVRDRRERRENDAARED